MYMYRWQFLFKITRQAQKLIPCLLSYPKHANKVLAAGLSSSLAVSFFSSVPHAEGKPGTLKPKNFDVIVREADALYDSYLIDNAYNVLKKFATSDCSELLWRLARVICEKAKLRYAILLDHIGEIEGNKSRILKSYEVKEHLERALQLCSNDATTWHILGLWHFSFADMGYATRLVATAIFETPPTSTYENALHYFLKAEEIAPRFYSTNTYYIGEVLEKMGNRNEAIKYYKDAFRMPIISADDRSTHQKAYEKLRKAGIRDNELA